MAGVNCCVAEVSMVALAGESSSCSACNPAVTVTSAVSLTPQAQVAITRYSPGATLAR